jgi:hypothetical protein
MAKKIEIHTTVGERYRYIITIAEGSALVQSSNLDRDEEFDTIEEMSDFFNEQVGFPMESYTGYVIEDRESLINYVS